jgi:hypothetical protein
MWAMNLVFFLGRKEGFAMKNSASTSIVLAAVLLAACGDSSTDPIFGGNGQGGDGSDGGSPADGGGAPEGGDGSGAGNEGGSSAQLIDPIAVGNSWTYDVEEVGTYPYCPSGSHTAVTLGESQLDGKTAYEVTSLCANAPSSFYAVDGDVVQVNYEGTWVLALDAPVEEGHTWSNGISTFTWHDEGTVTVGAGTFDDCWRATQNVDYEAYTIFCRGVGPVHWRSVDLTGNGFDATLTAKNF